MEYRHNKVEGEGTPAEGDQLTDNVGRIPNGLGSDVGLSKDWRSVVPRGAHDAYKLPGITSSNPCPEDICEGQTGDINTAVPGQHNGSGPHKQFGGTVSKELLILTRNLWM